MTLRRESCGTDKASLQQSGGVDDTREATITSAPRAPLSVCDKRAEKYKCVRHLLSLVKFVWVDVIVEEPECAL